MIFIYYGKKLIYRGYKDVEIINLGAIDYPQEIYDIMYCGNKPFDKYTSC